MTDKTQKSSSFYSPNIDQAHPRLFIIENVEFDQLNHSNLQYFISSQSGSTSFKYFHLDAIETNEALFTYSQFVWEQFQILVLYEPEDKRLSIDCNCQKTKNRLCEHQYVALLLLLENDRYGAFFSESKRNLLYQIEAKKYGLTQSDSPNRFFQLSFDDGTVKVTKRVMGLIDPEAADGQVNQLIPDKSRPNPLNLSPTERGIIFSETPYSSDMHVVFFEANINLKGSIKNPIRELAPLKLLENCTDTDEMRFYAALEQMRLDNFNDNSFQDRLQVMKRMLRQSAGHQFYRNKKGQVGKFSALNLEKIEVEPNHQLQLAFEVNKKSNFFEIISFVQNSDRKKVSLNQVKLKFEFFFELNKKLYLIRDEYQLKLYQFMKLHQFRLLLHESKFAHFKENYLDKMEDSIAIHYSFVRPAKPREIADSALQTTKQKTIYLEESDGYIMMTPAVKYGRIEIPILTLRNVRDFDQDGALVTYDRDKEMENRFISVFLRQHPDFEEQLGQFDYFYLPRQEFLDSGWFINAFEEWQQLDIRVLGFKSIKNNVYSPKRMQVDLTVSSGVDWFETKVRVNFGKATADLRALQKAIRNESRFVELGNGKLGLMPDEWIQKFGTYFRSSKIVGSSIHTSKINYDVLESVLSESELSHEISSEISSLKKRVEGFDDIYPAPVPNSFKAKLRDYQKSGYNWLCHLDRFNLGGCLADDMGLGKTIQVLAFLCRQKAQKRGTSLIVMPKSILFNWQNEIQRFAPSLNAGVHHGNSRILNTKTQSDFDLILTTYGTVLSDRNKLEAIEFNYIILDESQAIKNPSSQRYKTVTALRGRNKITMTGTPIENNTFDLYAQFSFLNPGMFVNQTRFKEQYSIPIDKFKDVGRAEELQRKINPFLLRRTKRQVAKELPEKTEMVLECEMGEDQRKIYDAYLKSIRENLNDPEQRRIPGQYRVLVLQSLMKLRQICNSPALLPDEASFGSDSAKIDVLMREITAKHSRHKILVFSQFVGMLELIKSALEQENIGFTYLTGQSKNRSSLVEEFKSNEDLRVFLISLKAGGVGLNLTEADYVYIVDPWWNPAVENQAIDRCYRIGQTKKVVAVRLITPYSIEEKIVSLQKGKQELTDELIRTDASMIKTLSEEELLEIFR